MPTLRYGLAIALFVPALALSAGCIAEYDDGEDIGDMSLEAQGDCSPVLTATPGEPQVAGTPITLSTVANCPSGTVEYAYYERDLLGNWTLIRDYTTESNFDWDTTGYGEGEWRLQAWVRRVGSGFAWEGADTLRYDIIAAPTCDSIVMNAATPVSPSDVGTGVTLSAEATCQGGATAEYQYWTRAPGGVWTIARAWDADSDFSWDTAGAAEGNHKFQVWTRAQGSADVYQAWVGTNHYLITPTGVCDMVSITDVSPVSPSNVGDAVTVTAAATCTLGASAEYKYITKDPSGTWSVLQDWSASDSAVWDTIGQMSGTWRIQVWSRASGSSAALEGATPTRGHTLVEVP